MIEIKVSFLKNEINEAKLASNVKKLNKNSAKAINTLFTSIKDEKKVSNVLNGFTP